MPDGGEPVPHVRLVRGMAGDVLRTEAGLAPVQAAVVPLQRLDAAAAGACGRSRTTAGANPSPLTFSPTADRSDDVRTVQESRSYVKSRQRTRRRKNPLATGPGTQRGSGELTGCRTVAGQQGERSGVGQVQRPFQPGENARELGSQAVDGASGGRPPRVAERRTSAGLRRVASCAGRRRPSPGVRRGRHRSRLVRRCRRRRW